MAKRLIRPIRIAGNVAYVPLTQGYEAIIDVADVALIEGVNWRALVAANTVYAVREGPRPQRSTILMHRVIMGNPSGLCIDHRDGNGLNNTRGNLRGATHSQNMSNQRIRNDNVSGLKGVCFEKERGKWRAEISANGTRRWLGYYETSDAAHAAYVNASAALHGEFGRIS